MTCNIQHSSIPFTSSSHKQIIQVCGFYRVKVHTISPLWTHEETTFSFRTNNLGIFRCDIIINVEDEKAFNGKFAGFVGWLGSNALDLYLGSAWLESWPRYIEYAMAASKSVPS